MDVKEQILPIILVSQNFIGFCQSSSTHLASSFTLSLCLFVSLSSDSSVRSKSAVLSEINQGLVAQNYIFKIAFKCSFPLLSHKCVCFCLSVYGPTGRYGSCQLCPAPLTVHLVQEPVFGPFTSADEGLS